MLKVYKNFTNDVSADHATTEHEGRQVSNFDNVKDESLVEAFVTEEPADRKYKCTSNRKLRLLDVKRWLTSDQSVSVSGIVSLDSPGPRNCTRLAFSIYTNENLESAGATDPRRAFPIMSPF
ncbi:hypothetical protein EVAR_135_1 [Eumeta japonica]|uniref:Uncharacterized protein n=1 Tax=Eumeta variegata TaxID=151549 RepID=A0A4C1SBU1_EUMVA|nr:hypothetical protein EVAR_135_1 [Eumeta japonica]